MLYRIYNNLQERQVEPKGMSRRMTFHMTNRDGKRTVHENCTVVSHHDKVSTTGILHVRNFSVGRALLVCEYAFVSKKTDISAALNNSGMCVVFDIIVSII